jgi:hypothetical protein
VYKQHGWARSPNDLNTSIIRYFPLERFLEVLSTKSLYFARLSQFDDAYDGVLPEGTKSLEKDHFTNFPRNPGDQLTDFEMLMRSSNRVNKYCTYASCWYQSSFESDAMWKLYGRDGIAVQSTFSRLRDSFFIAPESIYIGEMTYFDYATSQPPTYGNTLAAAFFKRIEYQHERELRAVVVDTPAGWTHGDLTDELIREQPLGIKVSVDLEHLIKGIILSPGMATSAVLEVRQRLADVGLEAPIRQSRLAEVPRLI